VPRLRVEHIRPFRPLQDIGEVADLLAVAFGDKLDPVSRIALDEMRRIGRRTSLIHILHWILGFRFYASPGYVWVEDGEIVGNVSLRRARSPDGFLIGNVAVHPKFRRRGIATQLMRAALREVEEQGGTWVGLEVETGNAPARSLYEKLGFRAIGTVLHMVHPEGLVWKGKVGNSVPLRRGRTDDRDALVALMRKTIPEDQRPLMEVRKSDYEPTGGFLSRWIGRGDHWWVWEEEADILGAVRVRRRGWRRPNLLEVLVDPPCSGEVAPSLVRKGLASLPRRAKRMVEAQLPDPLTPVVRALKEEGFEETRTLTQMRLDLSKAVSISVG